MKGVNMVAGILAGARKPFIACIACLVLLASTASAQNQAMIGVAWDANGEVCNLNAQLGQQGWLYILAYARGLAVDGFTGAEFRVDGFPSDWFVASILPNPQAAVSIGNPIAGGCNIAFPICEWSSAPIVLYTIHFIVAGTVGQHHVSVTRHSTPSDPDMPCPLFFQCDAPCLCNFCVQGGAAAILDPGFCATGVEPTTWSRMRSLFR
jgi:hypothetical protein